MALSRNGTVSLTGRQREFLPPRFPAWFAQPPTLDHQMYCPCCGSPVTMNEFGSAVCSGTGTELAKDFLDQLECCVVRAGEPRPARPLTCDPDGTWFCSDCGCQMLPSPGLVTCSTCGKSLSGFVNRMSKLNTREQQSGQPLPLA